MTRGSAHQSDPRGGERPTPYPDVFAREIAGTRGSSPRVRSEGASGRRSPRRRTGRLEFPPRDIDKVTIHSGNDFPATSVTAACARPDVLTPRRPGANRCPDFLTSDNVRIRIRPEILTQKVAQKLRNPGFFATENVRVYAQNVHFYAATAAKTDGVKPQFPTGRKFAKKIFIQIPTGRNFSKIPLDISNMVII